MQPGSESGAGDSGRLLFPPWQTGAYINEHMRLTKARAGYGKQILSKPSGDLNMDQSVLDRVSRFAAKFPKWKDLCQLAQIGPNPASNKGNSSWKPLSWSHFRVLITIEDDTVRYRLASPSKIYWPAENGLMFDHGFKAYTWLAPEKLEGLRVGNIGECLLLPPLR